MESCVHPGLQRQDDGLQLLQVRSEEHPVLPANEEPGAPSWSGGSRPRRHGDERRVFCFPTLRQEAQDQTGLFKGYVRHARLCQHPSESRHCYDQMCLLNLPLATVSSSQHVSWRLTRTSHGCR